MDLVSALAPFALCYHAIFSVRSHTLISWRPSQNYVRVGANFALKLSSCLFTSHRGGTWIVCKADCDAEQGMHECDEWWIWWPHESLGTSSVIFALFPPKLRRSMRTCKQIIWGIDCHAMRDEETFRGYFHVGTNFLSEPYSAFTFMYASPLMCRCVDIFLGYAGNGCDSCMQCRDNGWASSLRSSWRPWSLLLHWFTRPWIDIWLA